MHGDQPAPTKRIPVSKSFLSIPSPGPAEGMNPLLVCGNSSNCQAGDASPLDTNISWNSLPATACMLQQPQGAPGSEVNLNTRDSAHRRGPRPLVHSDGRKARRLLRRPNCKCIMHTREPGPHVLQPPWSLGMPTAVKPPFCEDDRASNARGDVAISSCAIWSSVWPPAAQSDPARELHTLRALSLTKLSRQALVAPYSFSSRCCTELAPTSAFTLCGLKLACGQPGTCSASLQVVLHTGSRHGSYMEGIPIEVRGALRANHIPTLT